MEDQSVIVLAGIGMVALACQWLSWWVRVPAIVPLLLSGIVLGPVLGWVQPETLFGELFLPFVSLSVAIILFEGSLTLQLEEIRGVEKVVRRLISQGMIVTWAVTTLITRFALGFSWELSTLFGALTVVTGPTVIVPMLRTVRPNAKIANILRWEGIVIDPVGALLAVLVFQFIVSGKGSAALGVTITAFIKIVVIGLASGVVAGQALGTALRRYWIPEYLHNLATLTLVIGVYVLSNSLQHESGLLSVTVMGIWLANMKGVDTERILNFKESLSILLISALFIVLAARIDFQQFVDLGWPALGVFLGLQFIARPLKVLVSAWGSSLNWRERALLGWIAPRGIVAAAIAALFALRLQEIGETQAAYLVPLTFLVIIGTVVLQSITARPLAILLKVAEPEATGFLIVGANVVARTLAKAIQEEGPRVLLADSNWDNLTLARMERMDTYHGNPMSEHADRQINLIGIGQLLALSPQADLNTLAVMSYRAEFGADKVYSIRTPKSAPPRHHISAQHQGRALFAEDVSYAKLASLLSQGAVLRKTELSEEFPLEAFQEQLADGAILLFAVNPRGKILFYSGDDNPSPQAGWKIGYMLPPEAVTKPGQS